MAPGRPLPPDPPTVTISVDGVPQEKAHLFWIWVSGQQYEAEKQHGEDFKLSTAEVLVDLIDHVTQRDLSAESIEFPLREYRRSQEWRREQQDPPVPD